MVLVTLALLLILDLLIPYHNVFGQVNQTDKTTILAPNNNMASGTSSNSTGIMTNTSGIIDDAIDALKNSIGSFFRK
ncbi:MAG TPA: hypothetical protein VH481_04485 [Nitrososphaeraceae archaeon]|jgi:hypothetical protein